jgi:hypothetical protein
VSDVVVVHHTNCGLTLTTDEHIKKWLSARSVKEVGKWATAFGKGVCFVKCNVTLVVIDMYYVSSNVEIGC